MIPSSPLMTRMPNCKSINLNNDDNILRHNGEEAHEGNPAWTSEIGLELTIVKIDQQPPPIRHCLPQMDQSNTSAA